MAEPGQIHLAQAGTAQAQDLEAGQRAVTFFAGPERAVTFGVDPELVGQPVVVSPEDGPPVLPIATASRSGTSRQTSRSLSRSFIANAFQVSQWRLPSSPGAMPKYVQRAFRIKTFGLMALQLFFVLGIMVLIDAYDDVVFKVLDLSSVHMQVIFYMMGLLNLVSIMCLFCCKDRYPVNYLLLALTTLLSGAFWGLTRAVVTTTLHFQIIGIIFCTMTVATLVSAILASLQRKIDAITIVMASLWSGWLVGVMVAWIFTAQFLDVPTLVVVGAVGFSFLLMGILMLDAGRSLVRCRPDDFMSVIVAMNSTLMVVVSIPFFVLSFCFLHTGEAVLEEEEVAAEPNPVPIALGRNQAA